ncbi:hypothetical protein N7536_011951 [Penicillium majusculum]|nr:hypothetical protein N7536_011951 [Penicillium majusculum]
MARCYDWYGNEDISRFPCSQDGSVPQCCGEGERAETAWPVAADRHSAASAIARPVTAITPPRPSTSEKATV